MYVEQPLVLRTTHVPTMSTSSQRRFMGLNKYYEHDMNALKFSHFKCIQGRES
jgi:hypothetical protein